MKCKLIVDVQGLNPSFDPVAMQAAHAAGEIYEEPHTITIPAGTEIDDPQCHLLCRPGHMNAPPVAEPIDEACKQKVAEYYARRPAALAQIRAMLKHPPKDKKARAHLMQLAQAYNVGKDDPEPTPPKTGSKKAD